MAYYSSLRKKYQGKLPLQTKSPNSLTLYGVKRSLNDWSKISQIPVREILHRLWAGESAQEAVFRPSPRGVEKPGDNLSLWGTAGSRDHVRLYGRSLSMPAWAAISGVPEALTHLRLLEGLPPKIAVFAPIGTSPAKLWELSKRYERCFWPFAGDGGYTGVYRKMASARVSPAEQHDITYHGGRFNTGEW